MRKLSSWEVMVVMVLLGFLEDTKPLRSGDPEGRRRKDRGGGWRGENNSNEESPNACCAKTTSAEIGKRRMAAKHTDRRDRREREVVVGEKRWGLHCFRVFFECVALLGFSILIRTVWVMY
jgi:hypothetical protein